MMLPVFTTPQHEIAYVSEWLTGALADGPLLTHELQERARTEFPLFWDTIETVGEKLGFAFGTFFALPYDHPYGRATRDSQRPDVGRREG